MSKPSCLNVRVDATVEIEQLIHRLEQICSITKPEENHAGLINNIQKELSDTPFQLSLSRGGWHRVGGLINESGELVAEKLDKWVNDKSMEIPDLLEKYREAGYKVTRQNGTTHYFTATTGSEADQFIQLEVEEIKEVLERNLVDIEYVPETLDEFIDPDDFPRFESQVVINQRYIFRRITDIENYVRRMNEDSEYELPIQRWFLDWKRSSASENGPFCQHWVMSLREYTDGYGEPRMEAKPISTYDGTVEVLDPDNTMRGSALANSIHDFDRQLGYSMAWYFFMLSRKKVSPRIAEAIHNDMQGAYAYLAPRDLKVLNEWFAEPYSV